LSFGGFVFSIKLASSGFLIMVHKYLNTGESFIYEKEKNECFLIFEVSDSYLCKCQAKNLDILDQLAYNVRHLTRTLSS
jgi:hypothetical protein